MPWVLLGTGEKLEYDRLILATGASAFVPPAKGADLPGCFVLREAADAQSTRSWRQEMQCTRAVVLGGGVLGVEAADSLRRLNLHTTIVQRSERLMDRELDEKGSAILRRFLDGLGMDVVTGASAAAILGEDRVREVELDNGSILPAEIFVACAGIRANTAIAVDAGLEVNRGVVVDDHMRTSDPKIFAVGDVAELPGTLGGLWTIGTAQAEVAASAVFGKDAAYEAPSALVSLKVEGIDVKAFGSREVGDDVEEIHDSAEPDNLHRKMFVKDGRAVGAVFVGPPGTGKEIARIIQQRLEVSNVLDRLRRFEWSALEDV